MDIVTIIVGGAALSLFASGAAILAQFGKRLKRQRALNGEYGEMKQWIAELKQEDAEFAAYFTALPDAHTREIKIIAESKDELRELTFERVEELT